MKEIEVKIEKPKEDNQDNEQPKKRIEIQLKVIETRGVGFDGCGNHTHK